ncbi:hypothetical protein SEPCBS57363_001385 [Sporothrix epigloea]|uniref:SH3 domain-containing protein n=1 Tax=Sporothrix epigloea TaxID=1892477 RepID=A0ABP0DD79_9PEZI
MGVDAEELILRSFREVVERGNETVTNAENSDGDGEVDPETLAEIRKAGQALVREGERALKRLQPLWDGQVEKYADAFKDALLQLDNIERRRRDLEDLLYDFEDYTTPASFEPVKFAELQAAARSFALDVINSTKRLKLDSPKRTTLAATTDEGAHGVGSASYTSSGGSFSKTSSFPPLPPLPVSMSVGPPRLASLSAIGDIDRRTRSSIVNGSIVSVPRSPSFASEPPMASMQQHRTTTASAENLGDDNLLFDPTSPDLAHSKATETPSLYSMPSVRTSVSHDSLHRVNTRSSVTTSVSGASQRGARFPDYAKRYQLYDHPEVQYRDQNGGDCATAVPDSLPRLPPSIPRTSAWVRSHQQQLHQLQQLQNIQENQQYLEHSQRLRAQLSRENIVSAFPDSCLSSTGYDSPTLFSRSSSLVVDDCVRSATTAAAASSANTVYSMASNPDPTDNEKPHGTYLSSTAPSYKSSSLTACYSPPLSPTDKKYTNGIDDTKNRPAFTPLHTQAVDHSPALATVPMHFSADSNQPLQSIQDFIKFAPSPPVPPISLPLSPRDRFIKPRTNNDDIANKYADEPSITDSESQGQEEQPYEGPRSSQSSSSKHQPATQPDIDAKLQDFSMESDLVERVDSSTFRPAHWSLAPKRLSANIRSSASSPAIDATLSNSLPSKPQEQCEKRFDNGLIVVEDVARFPTSTRAASPPAMDDIATAEKATTDPPLGRDFVRESDCSIGPKSTFEKMGGFCEGAVLYRKGGHWAAIKQQGGYVANKQASIGRCVSCGYGHNYEEVRLDMEKKPEATFTKANGVRFRLRLLYKSHIGNNISSQRQAESHYACVFCVQSGASAREGDATVFTTSDHLLLHIARHAQPLPIVPGITVLYGSESSSNNGAGGGHISSGMSSVSSSGNIMDANDFDLHLVNPPLPTPVPPNISQSAVATALCEHFLRYGGKKLARPPHYGGDMLHFLAGARIVGVMFPEQWEGKWCIGWHDGFVGAFPAKHVQIEPPRQNEIPMASSDSGMSVTARWKWKPGEERQKTKDKIGKASKSKNQEDLSSHTTTGNDEAASVWLTFEKGETIFNVKCLYADHWCWAGTNSKGRFGVFPQSHIITRTLQQETLAPARTVKTSWSTRSLFRGMNGRGNSWRPSSSSAVSSTSNSTGRTRYV